MGQALANQENLPKSGVGLLVKGILVLVLIYAALFFALYLNADQILKSEKDKLAEKTILIEHTVKSPPGVTNKTPRNPVSLNTAPETNTQAQQTAEASKAILPSTTIVPAASAGTNALPPAPLPELVNNDLPRVDPKTGLTPFKAYKRPFDKATAGDKPIISLIITDLGLSEDATESAIRTMPADISLVLSPYATALDFWTKEARNKGHETWLTLPLESEGFPVTDPGPNTQIVGAPERQNYEKLLNIMKQGQGYLGFVSGPNNFFTSSPNDVRPILGTIYTKGLAFVDGSVAPSILPQTMALGARAPYANVDIYIDKRPTGPDIDQALAALELRAKEQGSAIGLITPLPLSYNKILEWLPTLQDKDIVLAPLSAIAGGQ